MSVVIGWLRAIWLGWWDRIYERLAGPTIVIHDPPGADPRRSYRLRPEERRG